MIVENVIKTVYSRITMKTYNGKKLYLKDRTR